MEESNELSFSDLLFTVQPRTIQPSISQKEEEQLAAQPFQLAAQPFQSESSPYPEDDFARKKRKKQLRRRCCVFCCLGNLVVIVVTIVTLAVLAFTSRDPEIIVTATKLESIGLATDPHTKNQTPVNATVRSALSVKNPNKISSFEFGDSNATVAYNGSTIGQASIPAGKIEAHRTAHMNVTMTVFLGNLTSANSSLAASEKSGNINLTSTARLPGRIILLHIIKRHIIVTTSCNIVANISSGITKIEHCSHHEKF